MALILLMTSILGMTPILMMLHIGSAQKIVPEMHHSHKTDSVDIMHDTVSPVRRLARNADDLDTSITLATNSLLADQKLDGHWVYELETDATLTSQCLLLIHYLGETPNATLEQKLARYLRRTQLPSGAWALTPDAPMDINPSVQAYFALKMAGDSLNATHMIRARKSILAAGGGEGVNVFTRILLAVFGIVPWDAVPMMPVEVMLLPEWFPFHLSKVSFWARVTIVPLLVVAAERPIARNPRNIGIDELFLSPPSNMRLAARAPHQSQTWSTIFRSIDIALRFAAPFSPVELRRRAILAAVSFVDERLNGEDGIGGIAPAIFYSTLMYDVVGNRTAQGITRQALYNLLIVDEDEARCQPCRSPVWDTVLAALAMLETRDQVATKAATRGLEWLRPRQVVDFQGDWSVQRPGLRPGGWSFFYRSPHYPDVDDSAVVAMAMHRADPSGFAMPIARAREWVAGMQSSDGGWGAYDAENMNEYLNNIPFSDHGALIDPPTADVTGRCLSMLAQLGDNSKASRKAVGFLLERQEVDGSWYGRWGINYIYGTWSVLSALNAVGLPHGDARVRRAVSWLEDVQNPDGGWGEDSSSYKLNYTGYERALSTASQTAWAMMGLMAAGEVENPAVARGAAWLKATQRGHGLWAQAQFNGAGFPRVMYLRYTGYAKYFPLWALARYRNLKRDNATRVLFGM